MGNLFYFPTKINLFRVAYDKFVTGAKEGIWLLKTERTNGQIDFQAR
jgi:hypothetical protein